LNLKHKTEVLIEKLEFGLKKACKDIDKHTNKEGLALCFVTPTIHTLKSGELDMRRDKLIKSVKSNSLCDAVIWIGFKRKQSVGENHLFSGLLLAIKEVKKKCG